MPLAAVLRISLEEFLCGATGPEPWCRQSFGDYIGSIDQRPQHGSIRPVIGHSRYYLAQSSNAALLLWQNGLDKDVVGFYCVPGAVCIREDHQGLGLGAELILYTACDVIGGPPTAGLDNPCFSKSGFAAHCAAYRIGFERGVIAAA